MRNIAKKILFIGISSALISAPIAVSAKPMGASKLNRATYDLTAWAKVTKGGKGGRIIRVTNLTADGAGSLREAIEAQGPRIVVVEVGGVIDLGGKTLSIKNPYTVSYTHLDVYKRQE